MLLFKVFSITEKWKWTLRPLKVFPNTFFKKVKESLSTAELGIPMMGREPTIWNQRKRKELRVLSKKSARKQNQWTLKISNHRVQSASQLWAAVTELGSGRRYLMGIQFRFSFSKLSVLEGGGVLGLLSAIFLFSENDEDGRTSTF